MLSSMEKEKKVFRDTFELLTNSHDGFFSFLLFFLFPTVSLREETHMVSRLCERHSP